TRAGRPDPKVRSACPPASNAGHPRCPTLRDGPCPYGGQPRLLRALPDLVVRVADAGLGVGIALDLDLELEGLPDLAGGVLGGVLDGLLKVVAVERVSAPVVVLDLTRLGGGLGDAELLSREDLVVVPALGRLFHIIGRAGKGPGPDHVLGELRLRRLRPPVLRR